MLNNEMALSKLSLKIQLLIEHIVIFVCSVGRHGDHCCSSCDYLCNSHLHWLPLSPPVSISIAYFDCVAFQLNLPCNL